jgi:hypothetical protein
VGFGESISKLSWILEIMAQKPRMGLSSFYSATVGDALTNPKKLYIYIYI